MRALRFLGAGLGLLLAGVAVISAVAGSPGRVEILLMVVGAGMVSAAILGPRLRSAYQSVALITLNTLVLLLVLELGASVVLEIERRLQPASPDPSHDPSTGSQYGQEKSPYYGDKAWGPRLWSEIQELRNGSWYHPHEIWRRKPYRGELHSIDDQGFRVTPGASCETGALLVYTFGGSTMWGLGSPDWGTIPAYLQAHWSRTLVRPVCVKNFGDLGVTSTQSLITLERRLQRCEVPDLVVFYDGVNDLTYARIFGLAGAHAGLREAARRLDSDTPPPFSWVDGLGLVRLARRIVPRDQVPSHRYAEHPDDISAALGGEIVEVYLNNLRMVEALGQKFGFASVFFWQPHIWQGQKPLTEAERSLAKEADDQGGPPDEAGRRPGKVLYEHVYAAVARAAPARVNLHYIVDVFDERPELIYLDSHHITPEGNRLVADRMLRAMGDTLPGEHARRRAPCPA